MSMVYRRMYRVWSDRLAGRGRACERSGLMWRPKTIKLGQQIHVAHRFKRPSLCLRADPDQTRHMRRQPYVQCFLAARACALCLSSIFRLRKPSGSVSLDTKWRVVSAGNSRHTFLDDFPEHSRNGFDTEASRRDASASSEEAAKTGPSAHVFIFA